MATTLTGFGLFKICNNFLPLSFPKLFQSFLTAKLHWQTTVDLIHSSTVIFPAIVPLF